MRLRFLERCGAQYCIQVVALGHNPFEEPGEFASETCITRQPAAREVEKRP